MTTSTSTTGPGPPRKFTIRSSFGQARQRRSRKNRPCDACRSRKTACVIVTQPPCQYELGLGETWSRGLDCESSAADEARSPASSGSSHVQQHPAAHTAEPAFGSFPPATHHPGSGAAAIIHQRLLHRPPRPDGLLEEDATVNVSMAALPAAASAVHSLEDTGNRTAHFMGWAAEQDTYLLDGFRSAILSERDEPDANIVQICPCDNQLDEPPLHFLFLRDEFPDHTNDTIRAASNAIEAAAWPHGLALVRLYFEYVHPTLPILSKVRFLRQYSASKEELPACLRGAVYALASVFWRVGSQEGSCPFQQHEIVHHAHAALRAELEAPTLAKLQACLLLLHVQPPDMDSVETPTVWLQAAQATACAQMLGLHRDPERWSLAVWEKRLRRKLWWATYAADCWSAVCHGNPPHIRLDMFDVVPPSMDDMSAGEDVPRDLCHLVDAKNAQFRVADGVRFLEMIKGAQDLRTILDYNSGVNKTTIDILQPHGSLVAIAERSKDWPSLVPHCLAVGQQQNGPLHLSFFATQVLLFRGLMTPATRQAKATPGSTLRQWFRTALTEFVAFMSFVNSLTEDDLKGFWPRHARSQLILCGNFLTYLFLLASEPSDIEVAYGLLEDFQHFLQRFGATDHQHISLLLRPVRLRIDSFFAQAADLIKNGGNEIYGSHSILETQ